MEPFVRRLVLGVSRWPDPEPTGSPVDALVEQAPLSPAAQAEGEAWRALLAAGGWAWWQQAGTRSLPAAPPPALPDLHAERCCEPGAGALLAQLLGGQHRELLPEALGRLVQAGQHLRPELLAQALGCPDPALREWLQPTLGPRGAWLAGLNPAWAWADPTAEATDPAAEWLEADLHRRLAALAALRRQDPAAARGLLLDSWPGERAEDRARLLARLEVGLGMADEPFLEDCLDDRARGVREAAARLLVRLPSSRLALRMRARAEDAFRFHAAASGRLERLLSGPTRVVLHPPDTFTRSCTRDGMTEPGEHGLGAPEWWLAQILACVPPAHWERRFRVSPDALLAVIGPESWAAAEGLSRAALRFEEAGWLLPLWRWWREQERTGRVRPGRAQDWQDDLLRALPSAQAQALALELLRAPTLAEASRLALVLERAPRPWSLTLGRAWLDGLHHSLRALTPGAPHELLWWEMSVALAGVALPAALFGALPREDDLRVPRWRTLIRKLGEQTALRQRIYEEIPL